MIPNMAPCPSLAHTKKNIFQNLNLGWVQNLKLPGWGRNFLNCAMSITKKSASYLNPGLLPAAIKATKLNTPASTGSLGANIIVWRR